MNSADNGLGARYEAWRKLLLEARGELEALIDFSEDQHFDESPIDFVQSVTNQVSELRRLMEMHVRDSKRGELMRNGISVALLGAPNAGKSSLLNLLVSREAAIVSSEEGTTRDVVDVQIDLEGWLVRLGDMAGLRSARADSRRDGQTEVGEIEKEGMRRAKKRALESDLVLVVISFEDCQNSMQPKLYIDEEVLDAVKQCRTAGKTLLWVVNKIDRISRSSGTVNAGAVTALRGSLSLPDDEPVIAISCQNAASAADHGNLSSLISTLTSSFRTMTLAEDSGALDPISTNLPSPSLSLSTTHRQATYLTECIAHLSDFLYTAAPFDGHDDQVQEVDIVVAAEHLRYAADCMAKITGRGDGGDVEDVLGVVFEKFCVGK